MSSGIQPDGQFIFFYGDLFANRLPIAESIGVNLGGTHRETDQLTGIFRIVRIRIGIRRKCNKYQVLLFL